MFECVVAVTFLVYDLNTTEAAYRDFLGYELVERATISDAMAEVWSAPAMSGRESMLMKPQSGAPFRLRFIEAEPVDGYAPLTTEGWNATELLVADPDAMARRLKDSPFEIIGMPYDLSSDGNVRAMQVKGPSDEILYLTRISGERTNVYGSAASDVDRAFILVVGAKDYPSLVNFYGKRLNHQVRNFGKTKVTVLSNALGLDPIETLYELKLVTLGNRYSLELDSYPEQVVSRPRREGELPPGMSMVSFGVSSLSETNLDWRSEPKSLSAALYGSGRVGVTQGPGGEWIELIETPCN